MAVVDFNYQDDTTQVGTVAVATGIGDQSSELWYSNIIEKTPYFHQLAGLPEDADQAFEMAQEHRAPGIKFFDGGPAIREKMVYQKGNTNIWLKGWDEFDYTGSDELREFLYGPRWAVLPVGIALDEMRANQHRAAPLDLLREKLEIAMNVFAEDIGDKVINSDGLDSGQKVINGLKGIIRSDPTNSFSVGGWDLSGNSQLRNFYNGSLAGSVTAGAAGSFASVGRAQVREMYDLVYQYIQAKRSQVMLCSRSVWRSWMEALESRDVAIVMDATKRSLGAPGGTKTTEDGYTKIRYDNADVVWDPKMPDGSATAFSNMILFLTHGPVRLCIDSEYFLSQTELTKHKGQLASSLEILFSGNFVAGAPGQQGIQDGYDNP